MIKVFKNFFKVSGELVKNSVQHSPVFHPVVFVPQYMVFSFQKKQETPAQKHVQILNEQYQIAKEQRKFSIHEPQSTDAYFISKEEKTALHKKCRDEIIKYKEDTQFDVKINDDQFLQLLSMISYTYDNTQIVKQPDFQTLIIKNLEKIYQFQQKGNALLFFSFCSLHQVKLQAEHWEGLSSFIFNNYKTFDYEEQNIVLRSITDQNFKYFEIVFSLFQDSYLKDIQEAKSFKLKMVPKVLTQYRKNSKGSEEFFFNLEQIILENSADMKIEEMIEIMLYYTHSTQDRLDSRNKILAQIEEQLLTILNFITPREILAILYSFIQIGRDSDILYRRIEDRLILVIDEFSITEIKKLLVLSQNLPQSVEVVFKSTELFLLKNIDKVPKSELCEIYFLFNQSGMGSTKFHDIIVTQIIAHAHQMPTELLSRCLWFFALQFREKGHIFFKKSAEVIRLKLAQFSVKSLSSAVWSFAKAYRDDLKLFEIIQSELLKRINSEKSITVQQACFIIWAYIQNQPLSVVTLDAIQKLIIENQAELDTWDLSIIFWGFTKLLNYPVELFFNQILSEVIEKMSEMTPTQFINVFRGVVQSGIMTDEVLIQVFSFIQEELLYLKYEQVIVSLFCFGLINHQKHIKLTNQIIDIINKLQQREENLQKLVAVESEPKEKPNPLQDVDEYLKNEILQKYK